MYVNQRRRTSTIATTITGIIVAGCVISAPNASAHVGVELNGGTPTAGKSSTIYLRPGHGCDGDATNSFAVTLPEGATGKPQQKAGWSLKTSSDGRTFTWSSGSLPDDQWDTFGIRVTWPKLADGINSKVFALPAVQTCDAELTVTAKGSSATVIGRLPQYAGQMVSLKVDQIPLTVREHVVAADGTFTIPTTAAKVPSTSEVTAWIDGRMVGNSRAGVEAWMDTASGAAMPAPTVTVVRG